MGKYSYSPLSWHKALSYTLLKGSSNDRTILYQILYYWSCVQVCTYDILQHIKLTLWNWTMKRQFLNNKMYLVSIPWVCCNIYFHVWEKTSFSPLAKTICPFMIIFPYSNILSPLMFIFLLLKILFSFYLLIPEIYPYI